MGEHGSDSEGLGFDSLTVLSIFRSLEGTVIAREIAYPKRSANMLLIVSILSFKVACSSVSLLVCAYSTVTLLCRSYQIFG